MEYIGIIEGLLYVVGEEGIEFNKLKEILEIDENKLKDKIYRTKQIEDNKGETIVSEGIDANYMDMINYALFGLIKIEFEDETINN